MGLCLRPLAWLKLVHIVSRRLGHASVVVTLTVYAHVLPGDQKRAATRFAELVEVA